MTTFTSLQICTARHGEQPEIETVVENDYVGVTVRAGHTYVTFNLSVVGYRDLAYACLKAANTAEAEMEDFV